VKKLLLVLLLFVFVLSACTESSVWTEQQAANDAQKKLISIQPAPQFDWSLERDVFTQIYQLRNEAVSTYTVVTYNMGGGTAWTCPSVGYPIPADTQLTNPSQVVGGNGAVVSQQEPNGLFSSTNTVGTWVLCVMDNGTAYPVYTELNATAFPFPVVEISPGKFAPAEGAKPSKAIVVRKK
jgi:hypothetical protein